jgi:uncharacterized membrane protein YciS (DUF1049 family)
LCQIYITRVCKNYKYYNFTFCIGKQLRSPLKNTYAFIQNYFLNSAYSFALFGVYSLTLAPIINNFIEFGEPNSFVAIFGFTMLIAEFIALKFKLKIIRARTQLKRIEYKKQTGIDVIPTISPGVLFGFFSRLVFHVIIIMICMSALGYVCNEKDMSEEGVIAIMTGFCLEMAGLIYLFMKFDIYTDIPFRKKAFMAEIEEDDEWAIANLSKEINEYSYKKELAANIVLQIFSCMLFTTFWQYLNVNGIDTLLSLYHIKAGAIATFVLLFPIMVATIIIGLRPMQIALWIEASLQAFSLKEKRKNWIIFLTVGVFACAPTIIKYFEIFIFRTGDISSNAFPEYVQYILSLVLFLVILTVEIRMLEKKDVTDTKLSEQEELALSEQMIHQHTIQTKKNTVRFVQKEEEEIRK